MSTRPANKRRAIANALVAMILMCAFAWPIAAPQCAYASDNGHPVVVSMGDSYASGEGTEPFYYQDEGIDVKFYKEDFLAHRSELAWGGLLKVDGVELRTIKDNGWYFTAVSGAETKHILTSSQLIEWDARPAAWDYRSGSYLVSPQITVFQDLLLKDKVDYVTISIGGNDLQFVPVVEAAATEVGYVTTNGLKAKLRESLNQFENGTKSDLLDCYKKILAAAGENAVLIVTGYPHLFHPLVGCMPWVNPEEGRLINAAIDVFDDEMAEEISKLDRVEFVDVRPYFKNHEDEYINGVILVRSDQDVRALPGISSYSVHPNAKGHAAYARAVQATIDQLEREPAPEGFTLEGSWRSVGAEGFGQAQPGVVVTFDGEHCNFYSPQDTYSFYSLNGAPKLDCTNYLWGDTLTLDVEVVDANHMNVYYESTKTELERVEPGGTTGDDDGSAGGGDDYGTTSGNYLNGLYASDALPIPAIMYFDFYKDGTMYAGFADSDGNVLGESLGYYNFDGTTLTVSVDLDATLANAGIDLGPISLGILSGFGSSVQIDGTTLYIDGIAFELVE